VENENRCVKTEKNPGCYRIGKRQGLKKRTTCELGIPPSFHLGGGKVKSVRGGRNLKTGAQGESRKESKPAVSQIEGKERCATSKFRETWGKTHRQLVHNSEKKK